MADEAKPGRYCPLCDGGTDAAHCPNDGVTTLPASNTAAKGCGEVVPGSGHAAAPPLVPGGAGTSLMGRL